MASEKVVKVERSIVLEFANGARIRLEAFGSQVQVGVPGVRRGRKPGPATAALTKAMAADAQTGRPRSRQDYLAVLREAGHKGSATSASLIVTREAKRAFGRTLGRTGKARGRKAGKRGPQHRLEAQLLRDRMAKDKADGGLRDASFYLRWLVDQKGITVGLRGGRPIVYRLLRQAKAS